MSFGIFEPPIKHTQNTSYPIRLERQPKIVYLIKWEKYTLVDFTHGLKRESNPYRKTFKNWLNPFKSFLLRNFIWLFVRFDGEIWKPLLPFITARWHFNATCCSMSLHILALTHMWSLLKILLDWRKKTRTFFLLLLDKEIWSNSMVIDPWIVIIAMPIWQKTLKICLPSTQMTSIILTKVLNQHVRVQRVIASRHDAYITIESIFRQILLAYRVTNHV